VSSPSFYWFDYETFGIHPALDRPAQFAGVRTDVDLNIIGDELVIYNKLTDDYLPDPEAALVTGIGPETVAKRGLAEHSFIEKIKQELGRPATCNVGYNNIRFDDEFTRYTLFRNFFDPYEHEWRDGNSRWDLLDLVRLTRALRPEGIIWPHHADGSASNRLEDITSANGLSHENAHDALSDVYATIDVAKLIKQHQPRLFDYIYQNKDKAKLAAALNLRDKRALIHVSGMIPGTYGHTAIVMPIAQHPTNKNGVIVLDLRDDPSELTELTAEEIALRIFTPRADLKENQTRLGIKTIHINKAPVIAPLSTLDAAAEERLQLDKKLATQHREIVLRCSDLAERVAQALQSTPPQPTGNTDTSLYSGGFFSSADKRRFARIRHCDSQELTSLSESFDDHRVEEMLFRYRARNYPDSLLENENARWAEHCCESLFATDAEGLSAHDRFKQKLNNTEWPNKMQPLRQELIKYADQLVKKWSKLA